MRTFKLYGALATPSNNPTDVRITIGGVEVYNAQTSVTPNLGTAYAPVLTFEMPTDFTGPAVWTIAVTDGYFQFGTLQCNMVKPTFTMPMSYFAEHLAGVADITTGAFSAEVQTNIANTLSAVLPADAKARCLAGTSTLIQDARAVMLANETGYSMSDWYPVYVQFTNATKNGAAYDLTTTTGIPHLAGGDTVSLTVNVPTPVYEYDPPIPGA